MTRLSISRATPVAGIASITAGLLLVQCDQLNIVTQLHASSALHFVQGVLCGGGGAAIVASILPWRRRC